METKLGSAIRTLVEKTATEYPDKVIHLRKGLVGYICDDEHIDEGWVIVQFFCDEVLEQGDGVYDYQLAEIEPIE